MNLGREKSFLKLQVIWKDDHMFELQITVSNGRYFGITEVYETSELLEEFADKLFKFPQNDQLLFHKAGQKDSYAYFSMRFYCIDDIGHLGLEVNLEENVSTQFRPEEKHKLKLELKIEPAAIDIFQRELIQLAKEQNGIAILRGEIN